MSKVDDIVAGLIVNGKFDKKVNILSLKKGDRVKDYNLDSIDINLTNMTINQFCDKIFKELVEQTGATIFRFEPIFKEGLITIKPDSLQDIAETVVFHYELNFDEEHGDMMIYDISVYVKEKSNSAYRWDSGAHFYFPMGDLYTDKYVSITSCINKNIKNLEVSSPAIQQTLQYLIDKKINYEDACLVEKFFPDDLRMIRPIIHTVLRIMAYLNYLFEHPELKEIERKKRSSKKTVNTAHEKTSAPNLSREHKIKINGFVIKTNSDKVARAVRSKKGIKYIGSWTVRGHIRHYKNGKTVYIKPYKKGTGDKKIKEIELGGF